MVDHRVVHHRVVVIGAGIGGIGMGIALRRAGIDDFILAERAHGIGGTWRDNDYPGLAVDVPAQAYQFSFELNPDWKRTFATGDEVMRYVDRVTDDYDIRRHVRTDTDITARTWDEGEQCWRLEVNGGERELTATYVVSAIGAFVDPKPVDIGGIDDFEGKVLRSVGWDHDYDLTGKRVAVIGTGASAVQIVPEIADDVAHLDVYQRTPIWVGPKFDRRIPKLMRNLYRRFPVTQRPAWKRASTSTESLLVGIVVKHEKLKWVNRAAVFGMRKIWYRHQVPDAELRAKLTPDYSLGCKRPSVSSNYLSTFMRPHVELVTDPIERFTTTGIRTVEGAERPIDAVVLATGFRMASDPATHRERPVRGRDGFDLATFYEDNRLMSYESVSIPGLPNHFMIFGPYGWVGATWHQLVETASAHIVRVMGEAERRGATSVEVTRDAAEQWTERMRGRLDRSLWHSGECVTANSYYFDHHGDTPYLRPTSSAQAYEAAETFPLDDYAFTTVPSASPQEHVPV